MSSGHKTMTGFLTLITGLLLVITGLCTQWPVWAWPTALAALLAGMSVALISARRRQPVRPPERCPDLPIQPVERWEKVVRHVALPSLYDDYDFLFSATVRWLPVDVPPGSPEVSLAGLAVDSVLERASRITAQQRPQRGTRVQHQLDGELATMVLDPTGRVQSMAEDVQITLSESDRERLEKLATVRKNEAVWEHERKWERSKRAYLGDDVLSSTGSAVVWWLAKNEDRIDKTVSDIGLLAQLTSAANDAPVPDGLRHYVPGDIGDPMDTMEPEPDLLDDAPAETIADRFAQLMDAAGLEEDDPRRPHFARRVADAAEASKLEYAAELSQFADELEFRLTPPAGTDDDDPTGDERSDEAEGDDDREY